ncbi:hypothetical protein CBI38_24635 [Rhodococcus oxybenzonivorans]|uniref:DNA-binding protein n=1 Tax=Rhodococcus oxybenzonivorans TaxID=1990687 RepID=A0A2S2C046_9NOCA|nr:hypothetical protein [Rhodococcus oxybenzonivorans]AWK74265.1 hypothetical protein CBI38_24635 [Rhodococcus oxybenzonivorans]
MSDLFDVLIAETFDTVTWLREKALTPKARAYDPDGLPATSGPRSTPPLDIDVLHQSDTEAAIIARWALHFGAMQHDAPLLPVGFWYSQSGEPCGLRTDGMSALGQVVDWFNENRAWIEVHPRAVLFGAELRMARDLSEKVLGLSARWITAAEASRLVDRSVEQITKWRQAGDVVDNGRMGAERRYDRDSVLHCRDQKLACQKASQRKPAGQLV